MEREKILEKINTLAYITITSHTKLYIHTSLQEIKYKIQICVYRAINGA
jgi:hypothetical protein